MKTGALLLLVVPGCAFYFEGDDRPPFVDQDASVVFPTPDAWQEPDADPFMDTACAPALPCPSATINRVSVCGRLYDVETDAQIRSVTMSAGTCGDGTTSGGACDLQLRFHDALEFAGGPDTAAPLVVEEFRLDDCGRFTARNIRLPTSGFLTIAVEDRQGAPDLRRLTAETFPVMAQQVMTRARAYSIRRSTDEAWTATAGLGGATLVDRGVLWKLFLYGNTPVAGAQIFGADSVVRPDDDYYFSDTAAFTRLTIAPSQNATGVNGSALMINSGLVEHSGDGGERPMCWWSSQLAASIPGVLFVSPSHLVGGNGAPCP